MVKDKPAPSLPIRPHTYIPDVAEAGDWKGERPCMGCHLPKENRVHDYTPPKDNTARIIGETED